MIIRTELTEDQLSQIFREGINAMKEDLLEELRKDLQIGSGNKSLNDQLVLTSEVCRRWGRNRATLSKLIKAGKLTPAGKYMRSFKFKTSDVVALFGDPVC